MIFQPCVGSTLCPHSYAFSRRASFELAVCCGCIRSAKISYSFAAGASRNLAFDHGGGGINGGEESATREKSDDCAVTLEEFESRIVKIADMQAGVTRR
jgi:hypothetical protein